MRGFIISLPHRSYRLEYLVPRLESLNLEPIVKPGIIADKAPGQCWNAKEYGCLLAHVAVMREIKHSGPAFVFEDDARFRIGFTAADLEFVTADWGHYPMFLLGATQYHWRRVNRQREWYWANRKTNGNFAYWITPRMAKRFLNLFDGGARNAIDRLFRLRIYPNSKVPILLPNAAIADVSESDIRSSRIVEQHASRARWDWTKYETLDASH